MENDESNRNGKTVNTNTVTPQALFQYYIKIYNCWINSGGIERILNKIADISSNSQYFILCKNKINYNSNFPWKIFFYINCVKIEFRAIANLYKDNNINFDNKLDLKNFSFLNNLFYSDIINNVTNLIKTELNQYRPKIYSDKTNNIYDIFLNNFLSNMIVGCMDVVTKKFELIIRK